MLRGKLIIDKAESQEWGKKIRQTNLDIHDANILTEPQAIVLIKSDQFISIVWSMNNIDWISYWQKQNTLRWRSIFSGTKKKNILIQKASCHVTNLNQYCCVDLFSYWLFFIFLFPTQTCRNCSNNLIMKLVVGSLG